VHVVFNEVIPDPNAEYFSELEQLKIEVASNQQDPSHYDFLIGRKHIDDEDGLGYKKGLHCCVFLLLLLEPNHAMTTPIHVAIMLLACFC
jgi:hypothetical protein